MEGNEESDVASREMEITQWPDYLVIQLQRCEFTLDTSEGNKQAREVSLEVILEKTF